MCVHGVADSMLCRLEGVKFELRFFEGRVSWHMEGYRGLAPYQTPPPPPPPLPSPAPDAKLLPNPKPIRVQGSVSKA